MKYLLSIILCLWAGCAGVSQSWAFPPGFIGAVTQGSVVAGGSKTYLLQESFEFGVDGDNLTTGTSWLGTTTDNLEIDTGGQEHGGTRALICTHAASANNYKTYTNQSTGKHSVSLWYYHTTSSSDRAIFDIRDTTDSAKRWTYIQVTANDIKYSNGGAGATTTYDANLSSSTWHQIEVEIDVDAGTQSIYINGTLINGSNTGKGYTASVSPDQIYLYSSNATSNSTWIDDLEIYTGVRQ